MSATGQPGWRPSASLAAARLRARMLADARAFFAEQSILEVETPALSAAAVSDPRLESVGLTLALAPQRTFYLHSSPEFAMKRLLAAGWPDIFQICRVYRDGELGNRHQPEFTLVEWYRRDVGLSAMMQDTVAFMERLLDAGRLDAGADFMGYREAFRRHASVDPLAATLAELRAASDADDELARALGDDRDAWLDLLLTRRVAPRFAPRRLTVLHHYPASQAALARLCPLDGQLADRFEVFYGDVELANGYDELCDGVEQRKRCASDQSLRRQLGLPLRPLDERFLAALDAGLPPCCGVAVGFDRLVMINLDVDTLGEVQAFPAVEADIGERHENDNH